MIPKVLHRVLVGGYEPGEESERWWSRFAELNPGWELKTWRDPTDPGEYELGYLFSSCGRAAQLADLLRIEILWREGGVYVDADVEPLRSFDELLDLGFFIGTEDGQRISSGVLGAEPGHPALRALIDRLHEYPVLPSAATAAQTTGPMLYSRCFHDRDDVVVLPREVFYPYNPYIGISADSGWTPRHSICVHHWAGGGQPSSRPSQASPNRNLTPRQAARRAVRDRLLPAARRVVDRVVERPTSMRGTYVGDGRMLVSTVDGFLLHVPADNSIESASLVSRGWHAEGMLGFFDRYLRGGDWYVDIGAGPGTLALAAARRVGRWGKVLALEPSPELAAFCAGNASLNGAASVEIVTGDDIVSAVPRCAPMRLVRFDANVPQLLPKLGEIAAKRAVDFAVVDATRGGSGRHWAQLLETLETLVRNDAQLSVLLRSGATRPITVDEVRVQESLTPLVLTWT